MAQQSTQKALKKPTVKNLYSHLSVDWTENKGDNSNFPYRDFGLALPEDRMLNDEMCRIYDRNGLLSNEARIHNESLNAKRNLGWIKFVKDEVGWETNKRRIYGLINEKYYSIYVGSITDKKTPLFHDFMIDEEGYVYLRLINCNYKFLEPKDPDVANTIMWRVDCIANDEVCDRLHPKKKVAKGKK